MTQSTLERLEAVQDKAIAEVAALEAAQPPTDPGKLRLARERLRNIQDAWRDLANAEAWAVASLAQVMPAGWMGVVRIWTRFRP